MKVLKFVMYLFYRYYSTGGTRRIPYFSALCAVVFLIYIHIFQILIVFNKVHAIIPLRTDDARGDKYWKMALFLLPIFLLVAILVKPKDLRSASYDTDKIKKGNVYLIIYIIISVILLFTLMALSAKD